ncbi:hypothetical protein P7C71_g1293, partial [Lecanoromycetidae sp. Uapishka_2]
MTTSTVQLILKVFSWRTILIDVNLNTTTTDDVKAIANAWLEADHKARCAQDLRKETIFIAPTLRLRWSGHCLDNGKTLAESGITQPESSIQAEAIAPVESGRARGRRHYESEPRTKYVSKARRRADRARRAEAKRPREVEKEVLRAKGQRDMEPRFGGGKPTDTGYDSRDVPDEGKESDGCDKSDLDKEVKNDEYDEGEADLIMSSINELPDEEKDDLPGTDFNSEAAEGIDDVNVQSIQAMHLPDAEAQGLDFPAEAERTLVEMQRQPDPFATEDENKENWDPQVAPHFLRFPIEVREEDPLSDVWSISDDDQWLRGSALSVWSSSSGS